MAEQIQDQRSKRSAAGQLIRRGPETWLIRVFIGRDGQGNRRYYNETIHGITSKKEAQSALRAAVAKHEKGALASSKVTVKELLDGLHKDYVANGKSHSWVDGVNRKHLDPQFGHLLASKLTHGHVQSYIVKRQADGAKNATINRETALLHRAFMLTHQPLPPWPAKLKENNVRKGFFEHSDYMALTKTLPVEYRPVLTFAYYTGCRKGEILGLRWEQLDLFERVLRLEPLTTKNDEPRNIPLAPALYEMLKAQKTLRDQEYPTCPWIFFAEGERIGRDLRDPWDEACKAAGLWNEETQKPTKLFHDLRRTGVRNLVRSGVPESVAMRISGHKTRAVFERYNITSESDLKLAAHKLGAYIEAKEAAILEAERQQAAEVIQ